MHHSIKHVSIAAIAIALGAACGGGNRRALVPGPETVGASRVAAQPYVVRMSDGARDWEVEFPESATGYEVRIPLRGRGAGGPGLEDLPAPMTDADRELLSQLRRTDPEVEREGVFRGGEDLIGAEEPTASDASVRGAPDESAPPEVANSEEPAPTRPSYLLGISEVRRLYRTGNPEIAMVRLDRLIRAYPDDTRLLAMKGTLWLRLGRPALARQAWEEVLHRDPDNRAVQAALRRLQTDWEGDALEEDSPEPAARERAD